MELSNKITKLEGFLEREDADRLFNEIKREIMWVQCDLITTEACAMSYLYGSAEKNLTPKESINDLMCIVETIFETNIEKVWMWRYQDGDDHMCWRNIDASKNLIHIFLGTTRKLFLRGEDDDSARMHRMRHGDAVFIPGDINGPRFHNLVPENNSKSTTYHLCFAIEEPYSSRHRSLGSVHILGYGPTRVSYSTLEYPDGLPENMIATVFPLNVIPPDSISDIRLIDNPHMGIFSGITMTANSLNEISQHYHRNGDD